MAELLVEKRGPITILTLNRPDQRNALARPNWLELTNEVRQFQADPAQRVLIITGAGDQAFSAGNDLKAMRKGQSDPNGTAETRRLPMSHAPYLIALAECEKPVIAAINGLAVGGGMEISLCCDVRLAVEDAWFRLPEPGRGFIAGVASVTLPRLIPYGAAMDIMLCGETVSAQDAFRLGLVQQIVKREDLLKEAMRRANHMASVSQPALWGTKKALRFWRDLMLSEHHNYYEATVHRVLLSGDLFEGLKAFNEKRESRFDSGWPDPFDKMP